MPEVDKVKKSESGMIVDPLTVHPDDTVGRVMDIMTEYRISGLPVVKGDHLVGIVTNRDIRFVTERETMVSEVMTSRNLVTVKEGCTPEEAKRLLHTHRIEKLLVVDAKDKLKGLITIKDIEKVKKYPNACKDDLGRLRVGAAIGVGEASLERAEALLRVGADFLVLDSAHGHSKNILESARMIRSHFRSVQLIGGNIATYEGAKALIEAGVDTVKVGIGPGSICTTRVVAGVGVPQVTAIMEAARACREADKCLVGRRRHQVLRRRGQGHGLGRGLLHDGFAVGRNRGEPGRDRALPGPHLQDLSRHGLHRRHEGRLLGPLFPGEVQEAGARGHRGPGAVPGAGVRVHPPVGGRPQIGHGLHRLRQHL